ncbi:MAG: hypothetical protein KKE02_05730 [Alphaproteobacteria bacterium]|nr:hypothetical protein [Alphaproteobacteria bacterium]MBU2094202.1 hypothetical protein [Alphaproteobacteria bacterium]MBU2150500.1 hypothetical protein [Alphaproteobacteria bacterium]MBU2365905.1 hypothetical protein [Alphaproteobacteria bacterium]
MRARPATQMGVRSALALVLALLVLLGLASSGLALPEPADNRPPAPHDVQQASASIGAAQEPTAEATAARLTVAAKTSLAIAATATPTSTRWDPPHQDADMRRKLLRLGVEIRGPPAGRFA